MTKNEIINYAKKHKYFIIGLFAVLIWCYPYFFSFGRMALGDFSFFAQGYEAIRQSIVDYKQFPWWNPWVSGGVPLYGNPQFGVFSITTLLTLIIGVIPALKATLMLFTALGYGSMFLLLRKYFKVDQLASVLLALLWIFCTFFVFHLPSHFTFVWYLVAPLFIYQALTLKTIKDGAYLGLSFSIMALMQIHNPFVHLSLICGTILLVRVLGALYKKEAGRKILIQALLVAALIFTSFTFHRAVMTYQNMHDFPRDIVDYTPAKEAVVLGMTLPYSKVHSIDFINYPDHPAAPHGFGEATVTTGIFSLIAFGSALIYLSYLYLSSREKSHKKLIKIYATPIVLVLVYTTLVLVGFGSQTSFSPYSLLQELPILSEMRLSTRWIIFAIIAMLAFIGYIIKISPKKSFVRSFLTLLLLLGVVENLALNLGFQDKVFDWKPNTYHGKTKDLSFGQTSYFGKTTDLPGSDQAIPHDIGMPGEYREYEATTYNLGVLYANDSFVQLHLANQESPLCSIDKGCSLIQTNNARITKWSPNEFVIERTKPGDIIMNISPSNYMLINGTRIEHSYADRVAEPFRQLVINDTSDKITVKYQPSLKTSIEKSLSSTPERFHNYTRH